MIQLRLPRHSLSKLLVASGMMLLMAVVMLLFSDRAFAHGYVESPGSRGYLCSLGQNKNCGEIIYEPYSLEGLKGFPQAGPADGKIASAAVGRFSELDQQSATRWSKVPMTAGTKTFSWVLKVPHATSSWKYYMTKQNWDQNAPLSRASFDLTPFCSVNYGGKMPPKTYSDTCNVPSRTGYQVILAVWEIADTANAFYNVIDVNFGGDPSDNQPPTAPIGLSASNLTATSVSLAWNASSDNVGVSGYKIYNGSTQIAAVSSSTLNYNVTGLTSNTSYTFTVRAEDAAGNVSGASNAVTVTTPAVPVDNEAPTAPTGLHVMGTPTSSSVHLMWSASTDNVGVTGYRVYNGTTLVTTVSGTTLEYTVTGLTPDTSYTFTVRAIDAAGNVSADSNAVNAKTASGPAVSAWAPNVAYTVGTLVTYNGKTYECRQAHTSLVGWEPSNAASLWLLK